MSTTGKVSISEFEKVLDSGELKTTQIIMAALGIGVFLFGMITLVIYELHEITNVDRDTDIIQILTIANFIIFLITFTISRYIFESFFTMNFFSKFYNKEEDTTNSATAKYWIGKLRTAEIIRSALREASALMGLVVCIYSIQTEVIFSNAEYWINCIPAVLFIGHIIINFPTKEKYINFYQNKILNN